MESLESPMEQWQAPKAHLREHLTNKELIEREHIMQQIKKATDDWIEKNLPAETEMNRDTLAKLVKYLGTEHKALIDAITALFSDRSKYIERPAVKIYQSENKGRNPDIWLLGWRQDEKTVEATDIHDHMDSEAAIYVHEGDIVEKIFTFSHPEYAVCDEGDSFACRMTERGLSEGSTLTVMTPYIHLVEGKQGQELGVSIHGYYPPLTAMNLFEFDDHGKLVKIGSWVEEERLHC